MLIRYQATDGFDLSTVYGALVAALADETEETIGIDETTELVTNGTFDSSTTGWTANANASLSVVANAMRITATANGTVYAYQAITTVIGQTYKVSGDVVTDSTSGAIRVAVSNSSSAVDISQTDGLSVSTGNEYIFKAESTTTYIIIGTWPALNTEYVDFDNISVKATGNRVLNHNFLDSTVSDDWSLGAGWSIGSGTLTAVASTSYARQDVSTHIIPGKSYVLTYTISGYSAGTLTPNLRGTAGTARTSSGTFTETIIAGSADVYLQFNPTGSTSLSVDVVSLRLAVVDHSINANGLEVHGQLTKSPVATGATTMWFSGFSADNYLKKTGNQTNYGTSGFNWRTWFICPPGLTSGEMFFDLRDPANPTTTDYIRLRLISGGYIEATFYDGVAAARTLTSSTLYSNGRKYAVAITFNGSTIRIYINGQLLVENIGAAASTLYNANANITIGRAYDGTDFADQTKLALMVWQDGPVWTDQEIATIYENEKQLFDDYEQFSILGQTVDWEPDLGATWFPTPVTKKNATDTIDFSRTTINHGYKMQYDFDLAPFPRTEVGKALKFIRSTEGPQFIIDFEGSAAVPNRPIDVLKISASEPLPNNTSWHSMACQVREV